MILCPQLFQQALEEIHKITGTKTGRAEKLHATDDDFGHTRVVSVSRETE